MTDLWIAVGVMCSVSLAIFFITIRAMRGRRLAWANLIASLAVVLLLLSYSLREFHPATLIRWIPSANVVAWGNFAPICVALLASAAWIAMPGARWQRILAVTALAGICIWRSYGPLFRSVPALQPTRWTNGVCRQSTKSTCSAAAAATVLATIGVHTDEADMARLCLSREEGTDTYGLYRGLRIKAKDCNVRLFDGSADDLLKLNRPAVIAIGMNDKSRSALYLTVSHSVVFFGVDLDGQIDIGDPFAGRQKWTLNQLRAAWANEAIVLVPQSIHASP